MKLIVGLGNPGTEYADTRHNIGFMAADALQSACRLSPWKSKFHGHLADGMVDGEKILLLKPMTFMNRSGLAVGEAAGFHKINPADVIVLHDELELPPGKIRIKQGGGHAGHNGLKSVDAAIGADYWRVRLGIGRPEDKARVHDYVLHAFAKADRIWLEPLLDTVVRHFGLMLTGDASGFMNKITLALGTKSKD